MALTGFPRDIRVRIAPNGTSWTDITEDVFLDDGVDISRGRPGESALTTHSRCGLLVDNQDGDYSPHNPKGTWFGQLGRNTLLQADLRTLKASFTSTVVDAWGPTDTGETWSTGASGGTISASDYQQNGGKAHHHVPATSAYRRSYLAGALFRDVRVAVTVNLAVTDITGAPVELANLMLRGRQTPSVNYYLVRATVETDESVKIALMTHTGSIIAAAVTVPGLTHSSAQALRVVAEIEGQTLRAMVHAATAAEPTTWNITVHDTTLTDAGYAGIRSGVAAGNTNTLPFAFSYDDFEVRHLRATTVISSLPQRWNSTGKITKAPIEAAGIMRRLVQGAPRLQSTMHRALTRGQGPFEDVPAVAYWPCEDASGATSLSSALPGAAPLTVVGTPRIASFSDFACTDSIPTLTTNSEWVAAVPVPAVTSNKVLVRMLVHLPEGGISLEQGLFIIYTTGTVVQWNINAMPSGDFRITGYLADNTSVLSTTLGVTTNDQLIWLALQLENVGANIDWRLGYMEQDGGNSFGGANGTINNQTCGHVRKIVISPVGGIDNVAVGHISIHSATFANLSDPTFQEILDAYNGETAGERIQRLCGEEGISFDYIGDLTTTPRMGRQDTATLLDLARQAEAVDLGTLYEPRGVLGLAYRTRASLYNQDATLTIDQTANELAPPLDPTDDDQATRNDITVKRVDGSSTRSTVDTGRLSTQSPPDGVGIYDESVSLNLYLDSQLPDQASFRTHLGTVDEARYPRITVDHGNLPAAKQRSLLDLNLDDRIAIDDLTDLKVYGKLSQLARGYTEHLSTNKHTLVANCAPEFPWRVWEMEDTTLGRVDTAGSELAVAIDTDDTTLSVATTAERINTTWNGFYTFKGPYWTTDDTQFPFGWDVNGEDVTVTDIADELITFVNVGAAAHADNAAVTPGLPASIQAGDLLLLLTAIRNTSAGPSSVNQGYQQISLINPLNFRLWAKIATGSEVAPTVTFTGGAAGDTTSAQIAAYRGKFHNALNLIVMQKGMLNPSAQDIAYPAAKIPFPNCLVLYVGWKQDDWTSVVSPGTELGEPSSTLGSDQGIVWSYQIQTTAADIAAGSFTATGGAAAANVGGLIAIHCDIQTATVSRNINGLPGGKSHPVGTAVRLPDDQVLAL